MNRPETWQRIYAELKTLKPGARDEDLLNEALIKSGLSSRQDSVDAQLLARRQQAIKDVEAKKEYQFLAIPGALEPAKEKELREQKNREIQDINRIYEKFGIIAPQGLPALNGTNTPDVTGAPKVKFLGFEK
jgi:Arc/MetJ family transcription regulator